MFAPRYPAGGETATATAASDDTNDSKGEENDNSEVADEETKDGAVHRVPSRTASGVRSLREAL